MFSVNNPSIGLLIVGSVIITPLSVAPWNLTADKLFSSNLVRFIFAVAKFAFVKSDLLI